MEIATVAKTRTEQLEYSRGYNRGLARSHDRVQRILRIAQRYRESCDTPTESLCRTCDRWTRGGPSCVWGECRADFEYGLEPRMWADGGKSPKGTVVTDENFGCISWIPKPTDTGSVT
jgi:hypothetical protein